MKLCVLTITDGRKECLTQTISSWRTKAVATGCEVYNLLVDDSADPDYWAWGSRMFSDSAHRIIRHKERLGFSGAIRSGWASIPQDIDFILHLEDDFILKEEIDLSEMIHVLLNYPKVAQIALYRQPWSNAEKECGGYMRQFPNRFRDAIYTGVDGNPYPVVEHRHCFTTNPCVYSRKIIDIGWPQGEHSEGRFGLQLWDEGYICLIWGTTGDAPRVEHIGRERVGEGY